MDREPKQLATQIIRVINHLIFLEKRIVFQYRGLRLHPSEIHLMSVIHNRPDLNAGGMASSLGVSNGAVSQTLGRLEKKGVISRLKDPSQKNSVTAVFTDVGKGAMEAFEAERAARVESFSRYLAGLSDAERETIKGFLGHLGEFLEGLG